MLKAGNKLIAEQAYRNGVALVQQQEHDKAIVELRRAEETFRTLDSRGHPFNYALDNGISGLANTLFLLGVCHERSGDTRKAITCFETSLINERFERVRPFRAFRNDVFAHLASCYEREIDGPDSKALESLLNEDPDLDISFRFPFSLHTKVIPVARLYEIAPARHPHLQHWYNRSKNKDMALRRAGSRTTDDATMRKISIGVWSVIAAIWVVYGLLVLRTLMQNR